ncbi:SAVED domain-containing protein [Persephonella sp.]
MSLKQFKDNPDRLIAYIKSSVRAEEKEDLYDLLIDKSQPNKVKFEAFKVIRKREDLFDIEKISETLNIPMTAVKKIFKSKAKVVKFPVALGDKGDIASACIIPLTEDTDLNSFSNCNNIREGLNTIRSILKNKNYPVKNFFAVFDRDFTHKSYMLAIIAGILLPEEILSKFTFSGVLNEEGEIFPVGYVPTKKSISEEQNLKLITSDHLDNTDELIYYLGSKTIDIPFVAMIKRPEEEINISLKKLESSIREKNPQFSLEKLSNIYDLKLEDLSLYYKDSLPEIEENDLEKENLWTEQVKTFEKKLRKIYSKLEGKNRILHLAFAVPSSLAFALGIKFGAKKPVIIYHYQSDEYHPVLDLSDGRKLRKIKYIRKTPFEDMKNLEITIPDMKNSEDVAIAVWLASHNPYADVEIFLKDEKRDYPIVKIESKEFQGNIPLPKDFEELDDDYWIRYVSETYSALNILKNIYNIKRFHFFLSVPIPIAFGLGMAVGHFWDGVIYNLSFKANVKYYPVFQLNHPDLKSIF